jgi:hypothetical protein
MVKDKKLAHEVILAELEEYLVKAEELDKKMAICREQFGDDSPYHYDYIGVNTTIHVFLRILRQMIIPPELGNESLVNSLFQLKELTSSPGYWQLIDDICGEMLGCMQYKGE